MRESTKASSSKSYLPRETQQGGWTGSQHADLVVLTYEMKVSAVSELLDSACIPCIVDVGSLGTRYPYFESVAEKSFQIGPLTELIECVHRVVN